MELSLQPKQTLVFQSKANEILYGGGAGSGKAGDINIPVPTTEGWKLLKDISVGNKVFDENGKSCNVVAVTEVMYGRPCYEVTFNDGNSFVVDKNHQWWTQDKTYNSIVKTTIELVKDFILDIDNFVERCKPVQYNPRDFAISPYQVGCNIGDYTTDKLSEYLIGSEFQRRELLQGIIDARDVQSISSDISDNIIELLDSLGIRTDSRQIISVKQVESIPVKCIEVDSPNHVFLWGKGYVPTHNSHLLRIAAISYSAAIPGLQTYLFRRTSPDLVLNHMSGPSAFPAILAEWVESKHVNINYSKNEIRFWNGSTIHLCHCQHEKDKFSYQGAEIHLLMMDELTHFSESIYRYLRGRVRLGGIKIPDEYKDQFPRILCGTNPGNIGHMFVKKTWVDFAPAYQIVQTPPTEGGFRRQFIPALLTDNKILMENDPEYADRLRGLGTEALVDAMLKGSWDIAEGGYFDGLWNRDKHVIVPFDVPDSFRIDRAFDWGSSKPFSVGYWAESDGTEVTLADGTKKSYPRGTLFRIGEIYGWNGEPDVGLKLTAKEIAELIVEYEAGKPWGKRVKAGPADSAIYDKENGSCIADDMKELNVTWVRADKRPGSRVIGWLNMAKRLKACEKSPMEDAGLFIFDTCQQFIRTVPTLPRDPLNSEDIYSKAEDHVGDEARYRCNYTIKLVTTTKVTGL